jgi:hypothetical protein
MNHDAQLDDEQVRKLARLLTNPPALPIMIDFLPDPRAVSLLKVWRMVHFGPPPDVPRSRSDNSTT